MPLAYIINFVEPCYACLIQSSPVNSIVCGKSHVINSTTSRDIASGLGCATKSWWKLEYYICLQFYYFPTIWCMLNRNVLVITGGCHMVFGCQMLTVMTLYYSQSCSNITQNSMFWNDFVPGTFGVRLFGCFARRVLQETGQNGQLVSGGLSGNAAKRCNSVDRRRKIRKLLLCPP